MTRPSTPATDTKPDRSLAGGLFGLLCLAVAVAVLAGVRGAGWAVLSWAVPLALVGLGAAALVGTLRRRHRS